MKVSNPLTIVAIFAGVAETFATGALVLLPEKMQEKFIDFVMFFPVLIVVSFFLILVFKPQVLYAPSDFTDEENFLSANKLKDVVVEQTEKALNEVNEKHQINGDIKEISRIVAGQTLKGLEHDIDSRVLSYMNTRPREGFTVRGLGHIFATSKSTILGSLNRLEALDKIESGMDGDIKVWQIKT
ncbi:hypothetical protein R7Q48_22930 [Vibrio sp. 378]|uniref:hypothetical protein n=1 Tax=Vibrio TaxID=662 RepID=UPI002119ED29|nr:MULTISPECIES: hypothetical protein [Vibrio]MCQ9062402.1 hypothetical protein [Vibrio alginolyticus]MDW2149475.1 hypothetical protein [Vibrio sp. 378]